MDYAQLVADKNTANSIKNWLNWGGAPVEDILAEAQAYVYNELRVREMIELDVDTLTLGSQSKAMPADYIKAISFRRTGASAGVIDILDSEHMEGRNQIDASNTFLTATPTECQILGDPAVAYFNVKSDAAHPYRLVYYARPADLSGVNTTNFLTRRYPKLLRTACLMAGFEHYKNPDQEAKYEERLQRLIHEANAVFDEEQQSYRLEMYTER